MRVFDVRASSSPVGYPCAKFCFCRALHCWASPRRKIAYSISQSLSHSPSLFDAPGTEAFASEINTWMQTQQLASQLLVLQHAGVQLRVTWRLSLQQTENVTGVWCSPAKWQRWGRGTAFHQVRPRRTWLSAATNIISPTWMTHGVVTIERVNSI